MKPEFELLMLKSAIDSLGICCAGVHHPDGTFVPRDARGEGWNDCIEATHNARWGFVEWAETLSESEQELLLKLHKSDELVFFFNDESKEVTAAVLMSDTFAYACADAEEFSKEDLPSLLTLFEKFSSDGLTAWASSRRNWATPLECYQTPTFYKAVEYLKSDSLSREASPQ